MDKSSKKPMFRLKLLIDDEKNSVVLAESGKDFVDLLSDLLTLPMGTIVWLLEKHQNPQSSIVGCFNNLYKSVSVMDGENFKTEACKNLLLYPKSIKKISCTQLKMNMDDVADEKTKFFVCPNAFAIDYCSMRYSNFCTCICWCGKMMERDVEGEEADGNEADIGGLLSYRTSFIITEDMKVELNSMDLVMNVLKALGYIRFNKLREMVIDVSFEKVLTLIGLLFTSEAPLTEAFLTKGLLSKKRKTLYPQVQESRVGGGDRLFRLKVFVRKLDGVVLYAECGEEFVDFLFCLLSIPLEFAWKFSLDNASMGCVGNLCRSMHRLSLKNQKEAKCVLPHYYNFRVQPFDVLIQRIPDFKCLVCTRCRTKKITKVFPVNASAGFVKGETTFIVSDGLLVTPMNLFSTISLLSKLELSFNDIEVHRIIIGKAEASSILRASLITNSALTNGLSSFLSNKMKSTKKRVKTEGSC